MKRLYVGCRVRVVSAAFIPEAVGREGRIVGRAFSPYEEWSVLLDGMRSNWPDGSYDARSHNLEPIQDPGHQVISWEEMRGLLQPQGVEA